MVPPIIPPVSRVLIRPCGTKWLVAYQWAHEGVQVERVLVRPALKEGVPYWSDGSVPEAMVLWNDQDEAKAALARFYASVSNEMDKLKGEPCGGQLGQ